MGLAVVKARKTLLNVAGRGQQLLLHVCLPGNVGLLSTFTQVVEQLGRFGPIDLDGKREGICFVQQIERVTIELLRHS